MKLQPIPREEPDDEKPAPEGPTTVRPPPGPASATDGDEPSVATYQKLRESCRAQTVADGAQLDDELAVEAEVLRVAMDRRRGKAKGPG